MHPKSRLLNTLSIFVILTTILSSFHLPTASAQRSDGIKREFNAETGKVSFIGAETGSSVAFAEAMGLMPGALLSKSADPAMTLAKRFAPEFGLRDAERSLTAMTTNKAENGRLTVRYQQNYQGIPVMGGELIVNTNNRGELYSINGEVSPNLALSTQPTIDSAQAKQIALEAMAKWTQTTPEGFVTTEPELWIFDESLLQPSTRPATLVWRMDVSSADGSLPIRELILINAQTGNPDFHFNQIDTAWHDAKAEPNGRAQDEVPPTETPTREPTETPIPTQTPAPAKTLVPTPTSETIHTDGASSRVATTNGGVNALSGTIWYVATSGNDSNSCTEPGSPCATINGAISRITDGDVLYVASGTYVNLNPTSTAPVVSIAGKQVSLYGGWDDSFVAQTGFSIIDGKTKVRGVSISGNPRKLVTLDRFHIRNATKSGIYLSFMDVIVTNSSIYNNSNFGTYQDGGGINGYYGNLSVSNSTISKNATSNQGGGIYNYGGSLNLNNVTISENSAELGGGLVAGLAGESGTLHVSNSILASNTASRSGPDCIYTFPESDHTIISDTSDCTVANANGNQLNIDPMLGGFIQEMGYQPLISESPAVNSGQNCFGTADQRGMSRLNTCDIGAYEYVPAGIPAQFAVAGGNSQLIGPNRPSINPLSVALLDSNGSPVSGHNVTFTSPTLGASAIFEANDSHEIQITTGSDGIAKAAVLANGILGSYPVTVSGPVTSVAFNLENIAWHVRTDGADTNDCLSPETACQTITGAIEKADINGSVLVAKGTYFGTGVDFVPMVSITKNVFLSGGWDHSFSIQDGYSVLDGQATYRIVALNTSEDISASLENFIIRNGNAAQGGGLYNGGTLTIVNSSIQNNFASNSGGGIHNWGNLTLNNTTLSGNSAYEGGGISNLGQITINNSTISENSAWKQGGGFYNMNQGAIRVGNSILAGNTSRDSDSTCIGTIISIGNNMIDSVEGCSITALQGDQFNVDPLLGTFIPENGYHPILSDSPAIDTGNSLTCSSTDQRGQARNGVCDIGTYEYSVPTSPSALSIIEGDDQSTPPSTPFLKTLAVAVLDDRGNPIPDITVTFESPANGPGVTFADTHLPIQSILTDANGVAVSAILAANNQIGSYEVTATVNGVPSVSFHLLNGGWFVSPSGDDASLCTSPSSPCATIGAALGKADEKDTIYIAEGVYQGNTTLVNVSKPVTLLGGWDSDFSRQRGYTILDGTGNNSLLVMIGKSATMERFVVQNGIGAIRITNGYSCPTSTSLILRSSSIINMGDGIHNCGTLFLSNSTISNNQGTGIDNFTGLIVVQNSTITNNTNRHSGQGVGAGIDSLSGRAVIQNSILTGNIGYDNQPQECRGNVMSLGHNIIGLPCSVAYQEDDKIGVDPHLGPIVNGYRPLLANSPAIDSGGVCLSHDQRGVTRPQGNRCDIGAFEYATPSLATRLEVIEGNAQRTAPNFNFIQPMRVAVLDQDGNLVPNVEVTFTAPPNGASGTFLKTGGNIAASVSNINGIAEAPTFIANNEAGTYSVMASATAVEPASFSLRNSALYVAQTGVDTGTCALPASPCKTINFAIEKALAGDSIAIGSGTYTGTASEVVLVNKSISLIGGWNDTFTAQDSTSIIDGQATRRGILVSPDVSAVLDHFTIVNGLHLEKGAGIFSSGLVTLSNSTVKNNVAGRNISGTGFTGGGGGIENYGSLTVKNSTISNNTVLGPYEGGGIHNNGTLILNNSTLSGNVGGAAGIFNQKVLIVDNSTITDNEPRGLYLQYNTVTLQNTILAGNGTSGDCYNNPQYPGTITSKGFNLIGNNWECSFASVTGDLIGTNSKPIVPHLGPLQDNGGPTFTHALKITSPAIDVGSPLASGEGAQCPTTDQRGIERPQASLCDIGSYEGSVELAQRVETYSANNTFSLPGSLVCSETNPDCAGGDSAAIAAHQNAIGVYEFYRERFSRDSIDHDGMIIKSSVHYCSQDPKVPCPYANAFWNGEQMVYGDKYGFQNADDIVAHELTHGITQHESRLFYFYQSGAIDESFADLWGEYFDQVNDKGNDDVTVKWLIGEDVTGLGAFRSMKNPTQFGDPDKMTSSLYSRKLFYNGAWDNGGVHSNSGVNNKAVYLMVDGGTFNKITVTALGWDKVAAIYYEVNSNLLSSGSDYSDLYYAIDQACTFLVGTHGITTADCIEVRDALDAVQMNSQPIRDYNPDTPLCPAGMTTTDSLPLFKDDFESNQRNWNLEGGWHIDTMYASSPIQHMWGTDDEDYTNAAMETRYISLPAGSTAFLHFKHAFAFEFYGHYYFDGGVLEYSTDKGKTWKDAKPLFSGGQDYKGVVFTYGGSSELWGRSAFVGDSHGYVSSRYNLTPLAGQQTVQFRWRLATDTDYDYYGWFVDDVQINICVGLPSVPVLLAPASNILLKDYTPLLDWGNATSIDHYELQIATDSAFTSLVYNETSLPTSQFQVPLDLDSNTKYYWRVRGVNGLGQPGKWTAARTFRTVLTPPDLLSPNDSFISKELRPLFDWDAPSGPGTITGYTIQIAKDPLFKQIVHTGNPVTSQYIPTINLPKNMALHWRVLAKGANGPSAYSEVRSFTTPVNPPPTPVLVSPANSALLTNYDNPTLKWKPVTFLDASFKHYQVQVATDSTFSNLVLDDTSITSRSTGQLVTSLTLTPNAKYYWRVRAVNTEDEASNWSAARTLRAAILPPALLTPDDNATGVARKPLLDWEAVDGSTGYVLQVWKAGTKPILVKTVTLPANRSEYKFLTNLLPNTAYFWKVQTKAANGPSAWSQPFDFTTGP